MGGTADQAVGDRVGDVLTRHDRGDLLGASHAMFGDVLYVDGGWKELQGLHLGLLDHGTARYGHWPRRVWDTSRASTADSTTAG